MSLRRRNLKDCRIGEVVEEFGFYYRCVKDAQEAQGCAHCAFLRKPVTHAFLCCDYECLARYRKDKTNVHFVRIKIEEVEPWELSEK